MWENSVKQELLNRTQNAINGGGDNRIKKQHEQGKLTARERLNKLFDENTFVEVNTLVESRIADFDLDKKKVAGDGVVTGYGKINGRLAFASSEDFTVIGGTLGEYHSLKICHIMDMAYEMKAPFISINDSGGARIEEGISSLSGYSGIFYRNTKASGVIPQIAVILGPCAGGACYSPAICDFIFMCEKTSKMFITGPQVVKTVMGEDVTAQELGSAQVHKKTSGVAHFSFDEEEECLSGVRELLSYLPQNNNERPSHIDGTVFDNKSELEEIVTENQRKAYDVKEVVYSICDKDSFFEIQKDFARNMVIGLARIDGDTVGIVANQPNHLGGAIDCNASDKAARFIRFCDCFNLPILTLVDVTGFLPGKSQEHAGIIRHGAKMLYAYSEATVPKISLITRKAFGGAYIAMNSKNMGADMVFAWPIAQIAVMGSEGAVDIIFKKQILESENSEETRQKYISEYEQKFMNPYIAASRGYVDEVIMPEQTRNRIISALDMLKTKANTINKSDKKHGNIPL